MKDMFDTGRFLFLTCAIAGILLAFTEMLTADKIKAHADEALAKARSEVLPAAARFVPIGLPTTGPDGAPSIATVSIGFDKDGKQVGTVQVLGPKGYGGPIEIVLGLDLQQKISGVKVSPKRETPGLGTKLTGEFLTRFLDQCAKATTPVRYSLKKDGGDVDGITAATVSSRAFIKGIREGVALATEKKTEIAAVPAPAAEALPSPAPRATAPAPAPQPAPGTLSETGGTQ